MIEIPNDDIEPDEFKSYVTFEGADLSEATFSGADLSDKNLRDADLTGANLRRADLTEADLRGATLDDAALRGATLKGANLRSASLRNTNLRKADLTDADLGGSVDARKVDLRHANLQGAYLRGCDFTGGNLENSILAEADARNAVFTNTKLRSVDCSRTKLHRATFDGADLAFEKAPEVTLTGSSLQNTSIHLEGTDLRKSTLDGLSLQGASFEKANLTAADLKDADLRDTNLEGTVFEAANLREAQMDSADLEGASLRGSDLRRASLVSADLVGADLTMAHLFGAIFDGARIDGRTIINESEISDTRSSTPYCRYDTDSQPDEVAASIGGDVDGEHWEESSLDTQLRQAQMTYRRLEKLAGENSFVDLESKLFVRRQEMRRKLLYQRSQYMHALFAETQRWLFRYGEGFSRVLGVSSLIVLGFSIVFPLSGTVAQPDGEVVTLGSIQATPTEAWDSLYYSLQLFFTGTGVLQPVGFLGQVLVAFETITGPILLALLVFVLGRRASR